MRMLLGLSVVLLVGASTVAEEPEKTGGERRVPGVRVEALPDKQLIIVVNGPDEEREEMKVEALDGDRFRIRQDSRRAGEVDQRSLVASGFRLTVNLSEGSGRRDDSRSARDEDLLDQLDEARVRVELLEMELAAERAELQRAIQSLKSLEASLILGAAAEPEAKGEDPQRRRAERARSPVRAMQDEYTKHAKELSRERRRLADLEGRRVEPSRAATAQAGQEGRVKSAQRIIDRILEEADLKSAQKIIDMILEQVDR